MSDLTAAAIKQRAIELGFDLCGVARADAYPELEYLPSWLASGYAGEMHYMSRTRWQRADVRRLLPSARSVIVGAVVYHVDRPYSTEITDRAQALVARYAWGEDYHDVLRARLEALVAWMRDRAGRPFEARVSVDTAPVQERVYAQYAGIGWIGKNTCVINPERGSWLLLSEIICSLELEPDQPALDRCGSCTLCLEACPTGAIVGPGRLDARRCLSYLTIELKGPIPPEWRDAVGSHVFGCDVCQEVCPWNLQAMPSRDPAWHPRPAFDRPPLVALWRRSDQELAGLLKRSAIGRAKVKGLRRNLAVALGNSGDPASAAVLEEAGDQPSLHDPVVAEQVDWARRKLNARASAADPARR